MTVSTLPGLDSTVAEVTNDGRDYRDWIYAPIQQMQDLRGGIGERPFTSRVFGLALTHRIEHSAPDSVDQLLFHIWTLWFFTGIRLPSTEAGFLDATPIKQGVIK